MWFIYILIGIIALVINAYIAARFADIAADKGYEGDTPYFWICFFLGVTGYLMVTALPDTTTYRLLKDLKEDSADPKTIENQQKTSNVVATPPKNGWVCSCGRSNANYITTCTCGSNKRDVLK